MTKPPRSGQRTTDQQRPRQARSPLPRRATGGLGYVDNQHPQRPADPASPGGSKYCDRATKTLRNGGSSDE